MREPYISLIRKYLPDVTPDESLIATQALRLALADRLEAAMNGKVAPISQDTHHTGSPQPVGTPSALSGPSNGAATNPPSTPDIGSNLSRLWWIAAGVALAVLLRMFLKKRSS